MRPMIPLYSRALGLVLLTLPALLLPLRGQTPTPLPTVIRPTDGGTIVTATPTPGQTPAAAVINPAGGGTIVSATPTPGQTPVRTTINSADGGTIITATPTPGQTPVPAVINSANGGTIVSVAPAPISVLPSTAAAVAQMRRLVRDVRANTDNIKSKGNFGTQLWLIADSDFFLNWRKPETPQIAPVDIALRGQPLYTAIIFYGAGHDDKGLSNVSYDLTVRRPDKTVYAESKDLVGYQNLAAPDEHQLLLGRNYIGITLSPNDPAGLWTVEALVHDNIGRADLPLIQHFAVQPQ